MLDIVALSALCMLITGGAIWALRSAKDDLKESVKDNQKAFEETTDALKKEFKEFTKEIDRKLDGINLHVDQKVESVKTYVRDVHLKADALQDKIHDAETEFLEFKVELPNQFVTRREMEEFKKRVVRLEGPTIQNQNNQ